MILEYIIFSQKDLEKCLSLLRSLNVIEYISNPVGDAGYRLQIKERGNGENAANSLSEINQKLMVLDINYQVLLNESSAYYNKMLFPLINNLERKLRKLLYSVSFLKSDCQGIKAISDLEQKDFGQLFDLLFLDVDYKNSIKSFVNNSSKEKNGWKGFSSELYKYLEDVKENTLWDRALPGQVPLLRKNFAEVREKRNGVMHAHNMDKKGFNQSKTLFLKINDEIDDAIANLAEGALIPNDYNEQLAKALELWKDVDLTEDDYKYIVIENGKAYLYRALENLSVKEMNQEGLYECPNCGEKQLELLDDCYRCHSCSEEYYKDDVKFCLRCGKLYVKRKEDNGICEICDGWINEKIKNE